MERNSADVGLQAEWHYICKSTWEDQTTEGDGYSQSYSQAGAHPNTSEKQKRVPKDPHEVSMNPVVHNRHQKPPQLAGPYLRLAGVLQPMFQEHNTNARDTM
jgi:hypothetical protein